MQLRLIIKGPGKTAVVANGRIENFNNSTHVQAATLGKCLVRGCRRRFYFSMRVLSNYFGKGVQDWWTEHSVAVIFSSDITTFATELH